MRGRSDLRFGKTRRGFPDVEALLRLCRMELVFPLQERPFFYGRSCKGK